MLGAMVDVDGNVDSGEAKEVEEGMTGVSEIDEPGNEMAAVEVTTDIDGRVDGDIDTAESDDTNGGSETDIGIDVPIGGVVSSNALTVG